MSNVESKLDFLLVDPCSAGEVVRVHEEKGTDGTIFTLAEGDKKVSVQDSGRPLLTGMAQLEGALFEQK